MSRLQVAEATAAAVLAAAIIGTATGVWWLVVALPARLANMESRMERIVQMVGSLEPRLDRLEVRVADHERRLQRMDP